EEPVLIPAFFVVSFLESTMKPTVRPRMIRGFLAAFSIGAALVGSIAVAQDAPANPQPVAGDDAAEKSLTAREEQAFKQAAAVAGPSVVRIRTVGGLDRVGQVLTGTGPTTGVVVSKDGYVISSSFNFAAKPASILVELADGRRLPAEEVASDRSKMLTLLKVDADDLFPAEAAPRDAIKVGQWAIALGRTYDSPEPSVSVGVVSALDRIWGKAIQTDAKVSPVNYGGPLVDLRGRVMGILVPLSPQATGETAGVEWYDGGIGFAIPLADIEEALPRLKAKEELKPGLLGVELKGQGVLAGEAAIDRVRVGSPAEKAGLKDGDVIVEADGKAIARQAELRHVLGRKYAGDTIAVKVKRGADEIDAEITLVDQLVPYESAFLGILPFREPIAGAEEKGVGVRYVFADGPASKAGLQPRDRIVRVDDDEIADAAALLDQIGRKRPEEKVTIHWLRGEEEKSAEVTLAAIPDEVPAELPTAAIPAAPKSEKPAEPAVPATADANDEEAEAAPEANAADAEGADAPAAPRTGRFTKEMPAHERSYWAYVPDDYNPDYGYGLLVWVHPNGDTMEAAMIERWKSICDRRGIMIVAPKADALAGWTPNEAEFVKDSVEDFLETYPVARDRIFLHTYSNGGDLGWNVVFKHRELFRGAAAVASPLKTRPLESSPEHRLQFHLACGDQDNLFRNVQQSAAQLKALKYPVRLTTIDGRDHRYPPAETIEEIGRWADCLDRI
ncbi:MAG: PDZ domain-containing protein, partial [Planctomycetaceae bacterium]